MIEFSLLVRIVKVVIRSLKVVDHNYAKHNACDLGTTLESFVFCSQPKKIFFKPPSFSCKVFLRSSTKVMKNQTVIF